MLLFLSLCAVSPLILQAHTDIVVLFLFAKVILMTMLNT